MLLKIELETDEEKALLGDMVTALVPAEGLSILDSWKAKMVLMYIKTMRPDSRNGLVRDTESARMSTPFRK